MINATPNILHLPCALACIERGIPVLVEKPVADSPQRARELVDAAARHQVAVLVGHHRRHNALIAAAKTVIDSGELGQIVTVSAHWVLQSRMSILTLPGDASPARDRCWSIWSMILT